MKKMFMMSLLFLSTASQADVFSCSFTEPFVDTTYDTYEEEFTKIDYGKGGTPETEKNVSYKETTKDGVQATELYKDNKVLQTIRFKTCYLGKQKFPYKVKDYSMTDKANQGQGCCLKKAE